MSRRGTALGVLMVAVLLAGCGSSGTRRSVLYQGIRFGLSSHVHRVSDAEAKRDARATLATWKRELARRARLAPAQHFDNPSSIVLRQRLREDARRYRFRIVSIELLRPRQLAPKIVVQTRYYVPLARASYSILNGLDPRRRAPDDRKGWRYEGFYFEAQDELGIPFFATYTFMRGRGPGGGQWARSEPLYPFDHL